MVIVVTQSWSDLIPFVRSNSDYILVAAETSEKVRKEMHINWFSSIENMDQYHDMFKYYTDNRGMFVASLRTHSNNASDRVFWYKADHWKADFKFGSAQYWYLGEKYKKRKEEDEDAKDPFAAVPVNYSANNAKNVSPHDGGSAAAAQVEGSAEGQPYVTHPAIAGAAAGPKRAGGPPSKEGQVEGRAASIKKKAPSVTANASQDISKFMSNNAVTRRFVTYDKNGILRPDL